MANISFATGRSQRRWHEEEKEKKDEHDHLVRKKEAGEALTEVNKINYRKEAHYQSMRSLDREDP